MINKGKSGDCEKTVQKMRSIIPNSSNNYRQLIQNKIDSKIFKENYKKVLTNTPRSVTMNPSKTETQKREKTRMKETEVRSHENVSFVSSQEQMKRRSPILPRMTWRNRS